MPIIIARKRYANSSGSFTGVRNLTMDRAPMSPNDNAKDDLTTKIIAHVVREIIGITLKY
jgi:hypothetical protein